MRLAYLRDQHQALAKALSDYSIRRGIMSREDAERLVRIEDVALDTGRVSDNDLDWALNRMRGRALSNQTTITTLRRRCVGTLTEATNLTASQRVKLHIACLWLLSRSETPLDYLSRINGIEAIWQLKDTKALPLLRQISKADPNPQVRYDANIALRYWNHGRRGPYRQPAVDRLLVHLFHYR